MSLQSVISPKIAILMPKVWSVRNVVYSGVLRKLVESGWSVHIIIHEFDDQHLKNPTYADFNLATTIHELIRLQQNKEIRGSGLLNEIIYRSYNRRNGIRSYPVYRRWLERHYSPFYKYRASITDTFARLVGSSSIFDFMIYVQEKLYKLRYDYTQIKNQLSQIQPELVWATICVSAEEYPYILAARDLDIPIVGSILSFDNLTSRSVLPRYDHYMVWNERMRSQLIQYYELAEGKISITGSAQFDFHSDKTFHWSKDRTKKRLGLPLKSNYLLYTTSAEHLAPSEPELVSQIAQKMSTDERLQHLWLVVRVHPLDCWQRWNGIIKTCPNVCISRPWERQGDESGWSISSPQDQAFFISTLLYCEACLNIASTTAIDAAILDRPVIGIDFRNTPNTPINIMYEEYDTEHYIHLVESGGIQIAHTWEELNDLIHKAIKHPEYYKAERSNMVRRECGLVDGQAGVRIVQTLTKLVTNIQNNIDGS